MRIALIVGLLIAAVDRMGREYPPLPEETTVAVYAVPSAPADVLRLATVGRPSGALIGKVTITGGLGRTYASGVERAQAEARELGGNAIVIEAAEHEGFIDPPLTLSVSVYRVAP